jgi:hypothetical protein
MAAHKGAAIRNQTIVALHVGLLAALLAMPGRSKAAELKPEAVRGFNRYVQLTEQRMQVELQPGGAFLWVESLPESRRGDVYSRLQRGEIITSRIKTQDATGQLQTPGALIHHWVGTVFIPGASLQQVQTLLQDYDHHFEYFAPDVTKSRTLEHTGNDFKVYFRLTRKKIITVVLDTEYDVHHQQIDAAHAESRSYSTRTAEVEHVGETNERQLPPGKDGGFLWRLYSYWRFYEADHGVYVQCEAISLTRNIPTGLNWLIAPFIESIPKESLEFTLRSTRTAVLGRGLHVPR